MMSAPLPDCTAAVIRGWRSLALMNSNVTSAPSAFDASGAWRDRDGKFPIEAAGPGELKRELQSKSALFVRNLTEKMLTYALGRGLERQDRPEVDRIAERLAADGYHFSTLVLEIARSRPFEGRKEEEGGKRASR